MSDFHNQPFENSVLNERERLKIEIDEAKAKIYKMFASKMTRRAVAREISELIASGKLPSEQKMLKAFNAISVFDLAKQIHSQWELEKLAK